MEQIISFPVPYVSGLLRVCDNYIVISTGFLIYIYTFKMELKFKLHLKLSPISTIRDMIVGINKQQEIVCIEVASAVNLYTIPNPHKSPITRIFLHKQFATIDVDNNLYVHYKRISKLVKLEHIMLDAKLINRGFCILTTHFLRYLNKIVHFDHSVESGQLCIHNKHVIVLLDNRIVQIYDIFNLTLVNQLSLNAPVISMRSLNQHILLFMTHVDFRFYHSNDIFIKNQPHNLIICPHSYSSNNRTILDFNHSIQFDSDYLFVLCPRSLQLWSLPSFNDILNDLIINQKYTEACQTIISLYTNDHILCIRDTVDPKPALIHLFIALINGIFPLLLESSDLYLFRAIFKSSAILQQSTIYDKYKSENILIPAAIYPVLSDLIKSNFVVWLPEDLAYEIILKDDHPSELILLLEPKCLNIHFLLKYLPDPYSQAILYHRILHDYHQSFQILLATNHYTLSMYTQSLLNGTDFFNPTHPNDDLKNNKSFDFIFKAIPQLHNLNAIFQINTANHLWYTEILNFISSHPLSRIGVYYYNSYLFTLPHPCSDRVIVELSNMGQNDGMDGFPNDAALIFMNNCLIIYNYSITINIPTNCLFYHHMHHKQYSMAIQQMSQIHLPTPPTIIGDSQSLNSNGSSSINSPDSQLYHSVFNKWFDLFSLLLNELLNENQSFNLVLYIPYLYQLDPINTVIMATKYVDMMLVIEWDTTWSSSQNCAQFFEDLLNALLDVRNALPSTGKIPNIVKAYYTSIIQHNIAKLPNLMLKYQFYYKPLAFEFKAVALEEIKNDKIIKDVINNASVLHTNMDILLINITILTINDEFTNGMVLIMDLMDGKTNGIVNQMAIQYGIAYYSQITGIVPFLGQLLNKLISNPSDAVDMGMIAMECRIFNNNTTTSVDAFINRIKTVEGIDINGILNFVLKHSAGSAACGELIKYIDTDNTLFKYNTILVNDSINSLQGMNEGFKGLGQKLFCSKCKRKLQDQIIFKHNDIGLCYKCASGYGFTRRQVHGVTDYKMMILDKNRYIDTDTSRIIRQTMEGTPIKEIKRLEAPEMTDTSALKVKMVPHEEMLTIGQLQKILNNK